MSGYKYVPWADHEIDAINRPRYKVGELIKYNPPFVDLTLIPQEYLLITGIINTDIEPPYHYALLNISTGERLELSIWYVNNLYVGAEGEAGVPLQEQLQ